MNSLKYLDEFVSEPAREFQLSFEQYLILHTVAKQKHVTLMDIASERRVTRSAISRQIKVLLKRDYIYQLPDETDRRRLYLKLTASGRKAEEEITKRVHDLFASWIETFGEDKAEWVLQFIQDFSQVAKLDKTATEHQIESQD
ncbi:MarR family winged helix-turn-helix transcriptional regulator [Levilactobacillus bambusae]|uniref:MarR family transcriptional regulator n=1 Tax=Levilactobacillus bambusae TaxID=2024736 RepID=A0A2V1MX34_9LACO|nr:MarR family transcriptional regulator [Levilactobacillus bambusae]PWF99630.1 MarR family transcriptional regulator [Levilactobacillus bambusae]